MQLAIVLGVGCLLLFLVTFLRRGFIQCRRRLDALTSAFLQFHKQQCCFIAAIEIAGIVMEQGKSTAGSQDFIVNIPLALSGCLSVTFGLLVVSYLGRLTWLYIILTLVPVSLSIASLHGARFWWKTIIAVQSGGTLGMQASDLADTHSLICGSRANELNSLDVKSVINLRIAWVICCYCAICCLALAIWHVIKTNKTLVKSEFCQSWIERLESVATARTRANFLVAGRLAFLMTWLSCFTYLFYLYAYFKRHRFVSSNWDFGQIVAITVWAPSIVELLYMEKGRSLSNKGLE